MLTFRDFRFRDFYLYFMVRISCLYISYSYLCSCLSSRSYLCSRSRSRSRYSPNLIFIFIFIFKFITHILTHISISIHIITLKSIMTSISTFRSYIPIQTPKPSILPQALPQALPSSTLRISKTSYLGPQKITFQTLTDLQPSTFFAIVGDCLI